MNYERTATAESPITLDVVKDHLYVRHAKHDKLIERYLNAALLLGEKYTGKDFRVSTWKVTADYFFELECLERAPIDAITEVTYTVSGSPVVVASSTYYLVKQKQWAEIHLDTGNEKEWPTDGDVRIGSVTATFTTDPAEYAELIVPAMLQHVAWTYENRGDDSVHSAKGIEMSGAASFYDRFRTARI